MTLEARARREERDDADGGDEGDVGYDRPVHATYVEQRVDG